MDKSHILSGTDGRFWSYGCPVPIVRHGVGKGTQIKMATTDNLLLVLFSLQKISDNLPYLIRIGEKYLLISFLYV